jgi:hypothetical protein
MLGQTAPQFRPAALAAYRAASAWLSSRSAVCNSEGTALPMVVMPAETLRSTPSIPLAKVREYVSSRSRNVNLQAPSEVVLSSTTMNSSPP